jgi:hypothetical protein
MTKSTAPNSGYAGTPTKGLWRVPVTVYRAPAGSGKTTYMARQVKEWWKKNPINRKIVLILSDNHKSLEEVERKLIEAGIDPKLIFHYYGHSQLCPVVHLKNFRPVIACSICEKFYPQTAQNCLYKERVEKFRRGHYKILIAPFEVINNRTFREIQDRIAFIWIEEDPFKTRPLKEPTPQVIAGQSKIYGRMLTEDDYINRATEIEKKIVEILFPSNLDPQEVPARAVLLAQIFNPSPREIGYYYKMKQAGLSTWLIKQWYILDVIEIAKSNQAPIYITNASFDMNKWLNVDVIYFAIHGERLPVNLTIDNTIFFNPSPSPNMIVRLHFEAWYPRNSFNNRRTVKEIAKEIVILASKFKQPVIPVITFKTLADTLKAEIENEISKIRMKEGKELKHYNAEVKVMTFGSLKTRNDFEDYKVGFIVGSYNIGKESLKKAIEKERGPVFDDKDFETTKVPGLGYIYTNAEIEEFRQAEEDEEQYQAIMRFRPKKKPTLVFIWGRVPERAIKEFNRYVEEDSALTFITTWLSPRKRKLLKPYITEFTLDDLVKVGEAYLLDRKNKGAKKVAVSEVRKFLVRHFKVDNKKINRAMRTLKEKYRVEQVKKGKTYKEFFDLSDSKN